MIKFPQRNDNLIHTAALPYKRIHGIAAHIIWQSRTYIGVMWCDFRPIHPNTHTALCLSLGSLCLCVFICLEFILMYIGSIKVATNGLKMVSASDSVYLVYIFKIM